MQLNTQIWRYEHPHNSHCRTTSGFIIFSFFCFLSLESQGGGRGVSYSLSFVAAAGERGRERIFIHTAPAGPIHTHIEPHRYNIKAPTT